MSGALQVLNFISQMTRAPPGSFLAAILIELKSECMRSPKAWLFSALRVLSKGIYIPKEGSLLDRVEKLLDRIRENKISYFHSFFKDRYSNTLLHAAHDRLANRPRDPHNKVRILHAWADGAGRASSIFDVSRWSSSSLHLVALLMLGELPVNRTRAYFTRRTHLRKFCTSQFCKRACLHCLMTGDTLVLDSEWHWIFDCTHFEELRFKLPVLDRAIRECRNYGDRGFATVDNLVSLLKKVQTQYCLGVSLGSFIRQAISVRESWMSEVCARGRPCNPPEHWARNLFIDPPSDEEFPAEVAENFDDGQPWHNAPDELSCGELWRALDENM